MIFIYEFKEITIYWQFNKKSKQGMDSLKPLSCVDRLPKNLEANYQKFKATEYQVLLLFYGIRCLYGIFPEKYLNHFAMLSEAIYILVSEYYFRI